MKTVAGRPASVPFTALELILEEIHIQRKASLREWQESSGLCSKRRTFDFPDDGGEDIGHLGLVHPSWTIIARRALGRILVLSDITAKSARAAGSVPTFGPWTREVYLSFSSNSDVDLAEGAKEEV